MTNEQTIKILDDLRSYDYDKIHELYQDKPMTLTNVLDMAIKTLQEQADGEYISREAVIDIIEDVCPIYGNDYRYILRDQINELPSVAIPSAEPKMVEYIGDGYADGEMIYDMANCPRCNYEFEESELIWGCKFCPECGQALDWGLDNAEED